MANSSVARAKFGAYPASATSGLGSVPLLPCVHSYTDGDDGLRMCHSERIRIGQIENPKPRVIIHEMAHAYTLANRVTHTPGPLGIAHLYFVSLNLEGGNNGCVPLELYADVLAMLTLDINKSTYWKTCNRGNDERQAQALAVVRSAINGEMPQWFADTYMDSEGEPNLGRLWTDVKDLQESTTVVAYQLRNEFGGYCNNKATQYASDYADVTLRQPWRDGGCPPAAPSSLEVASGDGELTLVWNAPASEGGSDVEGYIVQWRSGYQLFYGWAASQRRAVLDSPSSLTYTIFGLTNGVEYDVRVRAFNHVGAGQPHDVESVMPSEAATPAVPENNPATGQPTINGTVQVGETITVDTTGVADADGLTNATFAYQWLADDADIAGATGSTYTLVEADESKTVKVRVSFTDDDGNDETLTSAATDAVAALEPPAKPTGLSATPSHDRVVLTWDDPNDDTITGYVILRRNRETDTQGHFTELTPDTGTAATTYTDDTVAAETPYTYRIKAINEHGTSERSRWVHVETTAAPTPEGTPEQSVSEGDPDLPNDNSTPGRVAVGGSATGAIGTAGDQDRFAVELVAGRTYQFDLTGSPGGGGTLPDTFFRAIYNSEGQYQADSYNDDFDGGRGSRVTFTPPESGTYYARVSGDRDEVGSYTLSLTDVTPQ